jgi:hypothetical protein
VSVSDWVWNPFDPYFGLYYSAPASDVNSLTIRGSDDNETIRVDGSLQLGLTGNGSLSIEGRGGDDRIVIGATSPNGAVVSPGDIYLDGGLGGIDWLVF